jgi:sulfoxide reductase heme-binding subunit YedZ
MPVTRSAVLGLKLILWVGATAPAVWLAAGFFFGWLGANPIEKLTHVTGMTTLVLLLSTLAVTPVRRLLGWNPVIRLRRPLGLFAFFYALLHFSIWMVLDLGFQLAWVWEDIVERPYITVGFTAFVLLIPLALTSTKASIRRLGRRWTKLHSLAYVSTGLGIVHFYWLVKADARLPILFLGIYCVLMGLRARHWLRRRSIAKAVARPTGPRRIGRRRA